MTIPLIHAKQNLDELQSEGSWDALIIVTDGSYSNLNPQLISEIKAHQSLDSSSKQGLHFIPCQSAPGHRLVICHLDGHQQEGAAVNLVADQSGEAMKRIVETGAMRPCLMLSVSEQTMSSDQDLLEMMVFGALAALWIPLEAREETLGGSLEAIGVVTGGRIDLINEETRADWVRWINAIEQGRSIARDVAGTEPERMAPPQIAELCKRVFKGTGVNVEVIKERRKLETEYPLLSSVARASWSVARHQPRVVRLSYRAPEEGGQTIALAGKGVTYDTGGADLKTGGHMAGMSRDKGGAAAVIGTMLSIAYLKPRNYNVIAEIGAVRNSIGSDAFVADEIIRGHSGMRVRIGNTDAEGRLVLADLLSHLRCQLSDPSRSHLLSVATLTGHAYRAVGPYTIAIDNDAARGQSDLALNGERFQRESERYGEGVELSRLRAEDFAQVRPRSLSEDVISSNNAPSTATPRGHQYPAAFLIKASGLSNHHRRGDERYRFTHLDIGGSAMENGDWQHGRPTAAPVIGLVSGLCPWSKTGRQLWLLLLAYLSLSTLRPVWGDEPSHLHQGEPITPITYSLPRGPIQSHEKVGQGGMVVADNQLASKAGAQILREGGDAVDAAVTTALVLGVLQPFASGIGGGGFAVLFRQGKSYTLDFREVAPIKAHADMYLDADGHPIKGLSTQGALAAAVPGEIAGLYELHRRHGKLPWKRVVEPAMILARNGFAMHPLLQARAKRAIEEIKKLPDLREALLDGDEVKALHEQVCFPKLANTLQRISEHGADGFYRGEVARELVRSVGDGGGIISLEDLATYQPKERPVLKGQYQGYTLLAMPPPSSGGVVILQALKALELILKPKKPEDYGRDSSYYLHALTEVLKHAFADRANHMGDPDFTQVPLSSLLSDQRILSISRLFKADQTLARDAYGGRYQSPRDGGTSHFNVLDAEGNAVAITTTINTSFGSRFIAGETGILLNNEMDDFIVKPGVPNAYGLVGRVVNAIQAKKRPLSSMSPTIIVKSDQVVGMVGGSGGPTIITGTLQVILNLIHFDGYLGEIGRAVVWPRLHHQWVPEILLYDRGIKQKSLDGLLARGHELKPWPKRFNSIQALWVMTDKEKGPIIFGASDPAKNGRPSAVQPVRLR